MIRAKTSSKPYAIPIEMRPLWRICLVVISIAIVQNKEKKLDINKVNILIWMLIRKKSWEEYSKFLLKETTQPPFISIDTMTYKAIEFSVAKEFIGIEGQKIFLTNNGWELFYLLEEHELFVLEREFLASYGKKITVNMVKKITGGVY